jgi:hypothetical protein
MKKRLAMLALLFLGLSTQSQAQTLDIGGIEIRLGQSTASALAALRTVYKVQYFDEMETWGVTRPDKPTYGIGSIRVRDGLVSSISKDYFDANGVSGFDQHFQALRDALARGGSSCMTKIVEDAERKGIITNCGRYLVLWQTTAANSMLSLSISQPR